MDGSHFSSASLRSLIREEVRYHTADGGRGVEVYADTEGKDDSLYREHLPLRVGLG